MKKLRKAKLRQSAAQMHALAAVRKEIAPGDLRSGQKYLREFTQAFRKYDETLDPEQLRGRLSAADIVLIGDYHALPSSQRFAAGTVEGIASERRVVVGVEAILSRDQHILDSWWRREIAEKELRRRLHFDREWGYEWQALYELLIAARDHAEGVFGLDCLPRDDLRRIRTRDRHAVAKICELRERHPEAVIVVLFGESHLAPQHLPAMLREALPRQRILTVLQNVDALYWQAVGENASAVTLGSDALCVFNSTPLEKYESYRLCLEKWHGEEQPDFAPAVYNLIFSLARCLGFRLYSPHNGTQPKYLADALPEILHINEDDAARLAQGEAFGGADSRLRPSAPEQLHSLNQGGCIYLPGENVFLIREFRMYSAAAEAARFLYFACQGTFLKDAAVNLEIANALAHFGARLLCPGTQHDCAFFNAAGENLYQAYLAGRISPATLRRMFLGQADPIALASV